MALQIANYEEEHAELSYEQRALLSSAIDLLDVNLFEVDRADSQWNGKVGLPLALL